MHTHMPYASALTRLKDMRLLPIGQSELGVIQELGYDEHYDGPAFVREEGERLAGVLGDKGILLMANHGALTVGRSVAQAYDRLYHLERAAQVQLYAWLTPAPSEKIAFRLGKSFNASIPGAPTSA